MKAAPKKKRKTLIGEIISSFSYKGNMDMELVILVLIMLLFGLIMVASASSVTALYKWQDSMEIAKKQLVFAVIGFVGMLVVSKVDYHIYTAPKVLLPIVGIVWFLVFITAFIGQEFNGARRWLGTASVGFQPSELAKIAWVLLFASVCASQKPNQLKEFKTSWLKYGIMLGLIAVPLLLQPHKSATILIAAVCFIIAVVGGANLRYVFLLAPVGILGLGVMILSSEYSRQRIIGFLDPFQDATGSGWQAIQSLYAVGSGGLFGRGLGRSVQKALNIPEPHNDFIFAVICEELGFVGAIAVLGLFLLLLIRCIKISMEAPDKLGSLITIGIAALIFVQVVINVAVVTSLMPVTGMPLPFFSAGGTSLIFTIASMGIVLNVSRQGKSKSIKTINNMK